MSHSVLVETAKRFNGAFYSSLARGDRIGEAMNQGLRCLFARPDRAPEHSEERLELQDWMAPVLFQVRGGDLALVPPGARGDKETLERLRATRLGGLPGEPSHGFVGRARALLVLHRLLLPNVVVALTGEGGQGKTALAVACARWLSDIRQVSRVAFASVEHLPDALAVLDTLGRQLVPGSSAVVEGGIGEGEENGHGQGLGEEGAVSVRVRRAARKVEQVLMDRSVLLVVDNLENILPPPSRPLTEGTKEILELIERFRHKGKTRILLTARQPVPEIVTTTPFPVPRLTEHEGLLLVRRVLQKIHRAPKDPDQRERIEALVRQVGGHPRALVLLAPLVAERGAGLTGERLEAAMKELEGQHPGRRDVSLLAPVRLSVERLPDKSRAQTPALGVFKSVASVPVLAHVLRAPPDEALELCRQLVGVGLADAEGPYLLMHPALGPAMAAELEPEAREVFAERWFEGMVGLIHLFYEQQFRDARLAAHGVRIARVEMQATLEEGERRVDARTWSVEAAMQAVTNVEQLIADLGLPRVLDRVVETRRRLQARVGEGWSHAGFIAEQCEIERLLQGGQLGPALARVEALLAKAGEADLGKVADAYDVAMTYMLKGRILRIAGQGGPALETLTEAERRFQCLAKKGHKNSERMASAVLTEQADVLMGLGKLEEAAGKYQQSIAWSEANDDRRQAVVGRFQLGTVRMLQRRYGEALEAFERTREDFAALGETGSVATAWHQIGMLHEEQQQWEAAEEAYKQSLKLRTGLGDEAGQADTLNQLGLIYKDQRRHAEAVTLFRQALEVAQRLGQRAKEAVLLNNLAVSLQALGRLGEARDSATRAAQIRDQLGHTAQPWKTWAILQDIEREAGDEPAARTARDKSLSAYRAYLRDGGEPMDALSGLIDQLAKGVPAAGPAAMKRLVPEASRFPESYLPVREAILAVLDGSAEALAVWQNLDVSPGLVEVDDPPGFPSSRRKDHLGPVR